MISSLSYILHVFSNTKNKKKICFQYYVIPAEKLLGHLYYINEFTNEVFKEHGITRNCCKKSLKYSIDITDSPNAAYTKLDFEEIGSNNNLKK